ncbi:polysaccharide deacetylase [Oleidesulfovibrio alaskensis G20]|uniref:Polysaccharide deacetylase n=1 Tax=Oleidesulfovibrio alaskensis (strain ATCC BAA-1058 / DSM 17464 / G20) TaxID=207559 RepID=Q30WA2_OLEA2|nr:polysaccharide deacetylase family protein [Oleidesulfovibrio alaskensis]ABB40044.1 polysaccharide deacetylase [Oleidesulfovibrio alaskensis G20]MBG0773279.1 polysaccharide deacetylase family protein [Oleidesulfovibrio alaskensis]
MKIVMYHYIRKPDANFPYWRFLHVDDFRRQLDFFQKDGNIVTREQLEYALEHGDPLTDKDYLLTFDDGLRDHYQFVLPELQHRNVTGIFSCCAGSAMPVNVLDVHLVHALIGAYGGEAMLAHLKKTIGSAQIDLNSTRFRHAVYKLQPRNDETEFKRIVNYCLDRKARTFVLEKLRSNLLPEFNSDRCFYLQPAELKEMDAAGMIVGGHTVTHNLLARLCPAAQREEIGSNIDWLSAVLGRRILWFCFPYGGEISYNEYTLQILEEHGIRYCLSVDSRNVVVDDLEKPLTLPRYDCMEFPFGKSYQSLPHPRRASGL